MAPQSARRDRTSSAFHRACEHAQGDVDPVRELPYRPAELRRTNRPDRWQHPTKAKPDFYPCFFRGVHRWKADKVGDSVNGVDDS